MKPSLQHFEISSFARSNPLFRRLYSIVRATLCEEMTYPFFLKFYLSAKPHFMQVTFIRSRGEDIGFFTCTYVSQQVCNKEAAICRVAIGVLPQFHGGIMPFGTLCRRIISYKSRHPLRRLYMVAYLANPLVYATIAKYTSEYWPRKDKPAGERICRIKEDILQSGNLKKNETSPFVLHIHFEVHFTEALTQRILNSRNPDVQYYLRLNPDFMKQKGVMTIVPVRWTNILANILKAMLLRPFKKLIQPRPGS